MLNRQVILYISNSYQKVLLSIDTGFFTASFTFLKKWGLKTAFCRQPPFLLNIFIKKLLFINLPYRHMTCYLLTYSSQLVLTLLVHIHFLSISFFYPFFSFFYYSYQNKHHTLLYNEPIHILLFHNLIGTESSFP